MSSGDITLRRVLLLPSAGMGHLIPFIRLANALSSRGISVAILAVRPTVTDAESRLLSSLPPSLLIDFPLAPFDPSLFPPSSDPFFLQMEATRRSAHLLPSLLSTSSPPFSSLIMDITLVSTFLPLANIPSYVFFTSSASMLALCSVFPFLSDPTKKYIDIADGVLKIPNCCLPAPIHDPNHLFTTLFVENGRSLILSKGVIVNTFSALEPEILSAFNIGKVIPGFPPVLAVGPLLSTQKQPSLPSPAIRWLEEQPDKSVLYVSFGNRTAMSGEQIRELGAGLEMSGCRFLWVVKNAKVDREEKVEIGELLGEGYVRRVEERGLVVKEWVEQEAILGHRAVGGFFSHCGWNSVIESVAVGMRILAWPRLGDQRVNAGLVVRSGLGVWAEDWAWEADGGVVTAEEISEKVREVMGNDKLQETAAKVGAEARAPVQERGSSEMSYAYLLQNL